MASFVHTYRKHFAYANVLTRYASVVNRLNRLVINMAKFFVELSEKIQGHNAIVIAKAEHHAKQSDVYHRLAFKK